MTTDKTASIDGDPIVYAIAFAMQSYALIDEDNAGHVVEVLPTVKEAKELAREIGLVNYSTSPYVERTVELFDDMHDTLSDFIFTILEETEAIDHHIILSGKLNFRYSVDPEYKANRKSVDKPLLYEDVRDMLISDFGAEYAEEGFEADDELGEFAYWSIALDMPEDYVICTIDKDLDTIPGWHYRWPTHNKDGDLYWVTPEEAMKTFWISVLTGDTADNIPGLKGIGPKKALKIVAECVKQKDYYEACEQAYLSHYEGQMEEEEIIKRFETNLQLLTIGKGEEDAKEHSRPD